MSDTNLRPIELDDIELLLAWRSNPKIYDHFEEQEGPLAWEDHLEWFANRSPNRRDWMIEYQGRRVGVVSVTETNYLSIYIGEIGLWGKGIATTALTRAIKNTDNRPLRARVHDENLPSKQLFEKCGFERQESNGEWLEYMYVDD